MKFSSNGRRSANSPPKPGAQTKRKLLAPAEMGERIRLARDHGHISRLALGYQMGCTPSLVAKWEEGYCWPKIPDLLRLSRCLGRPLDYFLHGLDGPSFEETALELGIITEQDLLTVRSALHRAWNGEDPIYPDPERDGITEATRDAGRILSGDIHGNIPRRRVSREGGPEE